MGTSVELVSSPRLRGTAAEAMAASIRASTRKIRTMGRRVRIGWRSRSQKEDRPVRRAEEASCRAMRVRVKSPHTRTSEKSRKWAASIDHVRHRAALSEASASTSPSTTPNRRRSTQALQAESTTRYSTAASRRTTRTATRRKRKK